MFNNKPDPQKEAARREAEEKAFLDSLKNIDFSYETMVVQRDDLLERRISNWKEIRNGRHSDSYTLDLLIDRDTLAQQHFLAAQLVHQEEQIRQLQKQHADDVARINALEEKLAALGEAFNALTQPVHLDKKPSPLTKPRAQTPPAPRSA